MTRREIDQKATGGPNLLVTGVLVVVAIFDGAWGVALSATR